MRACESELARKGAHLFDEFRMCLPIQWCSLRFHLRAHISITYFAIIAIGIAQHVPCCLFIHSLFSSRSVCWLISTFNTSHIAMKIPIGTCVFHRHEKCTRTKSESVHLSDVCVARHFIPNGISDNVLQSHK